MKRYKYLVGWWMLLALLASCNESLEDTYSDYAGDGKIRYPGKCFDLSVKPGWQRLIVEWTNSVDATVKNVKLSWSASGVKRDTLLNRSATSCDLRNLTDGTYRVDVSTVDEEGNESLVETNYGRPYTDEHEAMLSFTRGITKHYRVKNNLVFFMDKWNENFVEINLEYTDTEGKTITYPLTQEVFRKKFVVLPNVNTAKPISITRLGKLEGCEDLIRFAPIVLGSEYLLTSDFKSVIQQRYGFSDQTVEGKAQLENFINTATELEFDYSMGSLEDVLYFPRLKKIVVGKNRYLNRDYKTIADISVLDQEARTLMVLDVAHELMGVRVERYNDHYFTESRPYIQEMGNPELPELNVIPQSDIKEISCSVKDVNYDSGLTNLLDNNPATWWEPFVSTTIRTYELLITLKELQTIKGIKIAQKVFMIDDNKSPNYIPSTIQIQVSHDKIMWKDLTHVNENKIGQGSGEVTLLPMAAPGDIQYVRVILNDRVLNGICDIMLADITLYKD